MNLTINGESKELPESLTVADLLARLGFDRRKVAVEVNEAVVLARHHAEHRLGEGDHVEVVTLVGGGAGPSPPTPLPGTPGRGEKDEPPADKPLAIGKFTFHSRLITGT